MYKNKKKYSEKSLKNIVDVLAFLSKWFNNGLYFYTVEI